MHISVSENGQRSERDGRLYAEESEYNEFRNSNESNANSSKVKYSLKQKDSKGRELSEEQREFFKDSKIRVSEVDGWKNTITPNGALFPVYHGTNSDEFF